MSVAPDDATTDTAHRNDWLLAAPLVVAADGVASGILMAVGALLVVVLRRLASTSGWDTLALAVGALSLLVVTGRLWEAFALPLAPSLAGGAAALGLAVLLLDAAPTAAARADWQRWAVVWLPLVVGGLREFLGGGHPALGLLLAGLLVAAAGGRRDARA